MSFVAGCQVSSNRIRFFFLLDLFLFAPPFLFSLQLWLACVAGHADCFRCFLGPLPFPLGVYSFWSTEGFSWTRWPHCHLLCAQSDSTVVLMERPASPPRWRSRRLIRIRIAQLPSLHQSTITITGNWTLQSSIRAIVLSAEVPLPSCSDKWEHLSSSGKMCVLVGRKEFEIYCLRLGAQL